MSAELQPVAERVKASLLATHGEAERSRIERGVAQVAAFWQSGDGDAAEFTRLLQEQFAGAAPAVDALFGRFEESFEQLDGVFTEIGRELRRHTELDIGPLVPADKLFAAFDPAANLTEDLFKSKLAFVALANFPLTTLTERLEKGRSWSRRQWAEARLANRFARRVPGAVQQALSAATANADLYIAEYNIFMHHLVTAKGERLFPKGLRLISHWNLRDELKSAYATKDGLERQRTIAKVMVRIITQEIPAVVVNNPAVDWNPATNAVKPAPADTIEEKKAAVASVDGAREPDTRYKHLLACFHAAKAADPYSPTAPTLLARRFEIDREIPEARFEAMLVEIMSSPLLPRIAKLISERLGRPLEPFDIWYDGFRPRAQYPEPELDARVRKRYPTVRSFQTDLLNLLTQLGFSPERARFLSEHIVVDPSRGAGHALGANRRQDKPHLRTRVEKDGMDYKGFNIAVHELGHNVEQVFSLFEVDHPLLSGVPNAAFTEALAFVFQARDLGLLGLAKPDAAAEHLRVLHELWITYEYAGVGLVDMRVWHWMYEHSGATPAELREAVMSIAREVWNRYYAPVIGHKDSLLLGIYSHMISLPLYLPDYALGRIIAFQIEEHMKKKEALGPEFERMAKFGAVAPDLWMEHATGKPISPSILLDAAAKVLDAALAVGR
jgi:hypothetical protein